jgi:putative ABC transport system permease protein
MLRNYLIIATRHLARHKLFSIINIFCLAIGITFSLIIGVYVLNQENVDAHLRNSHQQYVIKSRWKQENMGPDITTLGPLAKTMKDEYTGLVANYYRFDPVTNIVSVGDRHLREDIAVGDTTFVSMYGFSLLYGNPKQAFINNQSAVVTQDFAIQFFGKTEVLGKVITIQTPSDGNKHDFMISAVLKKMPCNNISNFAVARTEYQVYLPMENNQYFQGGDKGDNWANVFMVSMIELGKTVSPKDLEKPFEETLTKYQPDFVKGNLKAELSQIKDHYLNNNNGAVQKMITTLSLIAIFILLLAVINFININIGTSAYRLKEVGLRKLFGSARTQLIIQFIAESLLLTFIATLISIVLYQILLPVFDQLLNTTLDSFWGFDFGKMTFLLLLTLVVGIISGIYPAFILSSSDIINSVKGKIDSARGESILRKTLLVAQFTLAVVVFIGSINISMQVAYFFNKDLGYDKEQVIVISSMPYQFDSMGIVKMENIKTQLRQMPEVKAVCLSGDIPDGSDGHVNIYSQNSSSPISMLLQTADQDYAKVFGIKTKEGIFLNYDDANYHPGKVVLNETAEKVLGSESAVGKIINMGGANGLPLTIVGVVKDFHFQSMRHAVQPLVIANMNETFTRGYRYFSIKLNGSNINNSILAIEKKWKLFFPDSGFEYTFMDDKFRSLYKSELQLKRAAGIGTILNLIIVFMGVVGVVAFTLNRRTKEIAVRKVLGADTVRIILLFIKEYAWLVVIANVIAWPIAFSITNKWLENYTYHIKQDILPYLLVCLFIFIAVFLLIAAQSFKAANSNPVDSLRSE